MSPARLLLAFISISAAGCMNSYTVEDSPPILIAQAPLAAATQTIVPVDDGRTIPVLQSRHLDRLTEVIKIFDIHVPVGGQDAALAILQAQAAAVGADAVVGAEFHHGEGDGEPIHVSGMAVRFIQLTP